MLELSPDERGCIQRALWVRRDNLQAELLFTETLALNGNRQAGETCRIIRNEVALIGQCMRALWIVYGKGTNDNYVDVAPTDPTRKP
jgi:hypothetical protein